MVERVKPKRVKRVKTRREMQALSPRTAEQQKTRKVFKPEFNEQVERLCKLGVTDNEVAKFFNVGWSTVQKWKKTHPEFFEALQRGKLEADTEVAASLFKMANGFTYQQEQLVKKRHSKTDKKGNTQTWETIERVYVEQHSLPNPTSIIFYLKNRRPDLWRDVQHIKNPKPGDPEEGEKIYTTPQDVLAEMKKRGIVMIEGAYTVDNGRASQG